VSTLTHEFVSLSENQLRGTEKNDASYTDKNSYFLHHPSGIVQYFIQKLYRSTLSWPPSICQMCSNHL